MTENASPTDSALRSLVSADPPAPADARDRVRARLAAAIPAMGRDPGDGRPGGSPGGAALWSVKTGAIALAAFVVGGGVGAGLVASLARPETRIVYVDRPMPHAVITVSPPPPPPPPMAPASVPPAAPAATMTRSAPAAAPAPAQTHASQLAAERTLLDRARSALVEGDPDRALEILAQHEARFPSAILGEERDAMQVEALVNAGRADEARARADAFRARSPQSLFLATVESAIASLH